MIEIYLQDPSECVKENMVLITSILLWLMQELKKDEHKDIECSGFIMCDDEQGKKGMSALLFLDTAVHKPVLQILMQPPEEYKGKYIACIPSKEPEVVAESSEMDDGEEYRDQHRKRKYVDGMEEQE